MNDYFNNTYHCIESKIYYLLTAYSSKLLSQADNSVALARLALICVLRSTLSNLRYTQLTDQNFNPK